MIPSLDEIINSPEFQLYRITTDRGFQAQVLWGKRDSTWEEIEGSSEQSSKYSGFIQRFPGKCNV
jgi:hypothetical protein